MCVITSGYEQSAYRKNYTSAHANTKNSSHKVDGMRDFFLQFL
jgi:hypothetical protein